MSRPRGHYERTGAPLALLGAVLDAELAARLGLREHHVHDARRRHGVKSRFNPAQPKHRSVGTRTYCSWQSMLKRCRNPRTVQWKWYGGRGIKVCERWLSFETFLADMGERPAGASLDRIDNDGNYEPGNVRWATRYEQAMNRRCVLRLTAAGVCLTVVEWSSRTGIKKGTIRMRLLRGWPVERAIGIRER